MKKKIPEQDYPLVMIDITQDPKTFELHISYSRKSSSSVYIDEIELSALEEGIKSIRKYQELIKSMKAGKVK